MEFLDVLKDILERREKHVNPPEYEGVPLPANIRRAGVLILLLPVSKNTNEGYNVLFNQRSEQVPKHKGQIAFPGGGYMNDDLTLKNTALRETFEETSLTISPSNILGELDDFLTISDYMVTPFVGTGPLPPRTYHPDGWEITEIFEVPLTHLLDPKNYEVKQREYKGKSYPIHFYYYKNRIIWGVTGEILNSFLELVKESLHVGANIHP